MPPPPPRSSSAIHLGPTVSSPLFDVTGNQHGSQAMVSRSQPFSAPAHQAQVMGYSAAHSYHSQQTHEWSQRAYKGILNSPSPGGIVTLNLGVYEPTVDPKGRPILVQVIILLIFIYSIKFIFYFLFFSQFSRLWKFIPLFWTSILFMISRKNYSNLLGPSVAKSHLTSIQWFCVKQPKENGKKYRLTSRDLWCILVIAFSNLRKRSRIQLQFSMPAHRSCLDWSSEKMYGITFKLRRVWRCVKKNLAYY